MGMSSSCRFLLKKVFREEFPELDAAARGAISIGRRLLNPLSELVKIEPANIGIGPYQYDVKTKNLKSILEKVIENCVNKVGSNLNLATASELRYISGLNPLLAGRIVEYRRKNGLFKNRRQLLDVPGITEQIYEVTKPPKRFCLNLALPPAT